MLTHPTIDQLRALKLDGMADAFTELQSQDRAKDLDHAEWLALLLDREAASRNTKRFQSRLRVARLRHSQAAIEDVDFRTPRRLDKALFQQLATSRWIAERRSLLVTGPCGVASPGCPARWRTRPAATVTPSTTPARRGCSPISNSRTATAGSPDCSACWSRSISSFSMIGVPIASPPASAAISWKSSRIATAAAPS